MSSFSSLRVSFRVGVAVLLAGAGFGQTAEEIPREGEPLARQLAVGEIHSWTLVLETGEFLELVVEQHGIDVALELYDPRGALRTRLDSPVGDDEPEELLDVAPESGTYRLAISAVKKEAPPGSYAVRPPLHRPATETDRQRVEADRLQRQAHQLRRSKNFDGAITTYREALAVWQRLGEARRQAETFQGLARAYNDMGELTKTLELFDAALALAPSLADAKLEAKLLQGKAGVLQRLGKMPEAIELFKQSLVLYEAMGDERGVAGTLGLLGTAYHGTGQIQRALDSFEQALEHRAGLEKQLGLANVLANMVPLLLALNRPEEALERAQEALGIYRSLGEPKNIAKGLKLVADAAFWLEDDSLAETSLSEAFTTFPDFDQHDRASALNTLGIIKWRRGELEPASKLLGEALELARSARQPELIAAILTGLGLLERSARNPQRALEHHLEALELQRFTGNLLGETTSRVRAAEALRDLGRFEEAWKLIGPGLKQLEDLRYQPNSSGVRIRYFAFRQGYYEIAIDLLMHLDAVRPEQGYRALALKIHEQRLARELLDALNEKSAKGTLALDPELFERERELQVQIRHRTLLDPSGDRAPLSDRGDLEEPLGELDEVRGKIRRRLARYASLDPARPLGLDEMHQLLDEDTLLLVYALGDVTSHLWALDRSTLTAYSLPPRSQLETLARRLARWLSDPRRSGARVRQQDADRLAQLLLGPLGERLDRRRLIVISEGALQLIPFAALPDPRSAKSQPLVVAHEIVSAPSISVLSQLRRERLGRTVPRMKVAAFVDPVFNPSDARFSTDASWLQRPVIKGTENSWSSDLERAISRSGLNVLERLESSSIEGRSIVEAAGDRGLLVSGFDASRETLEALRASDYQILHFATHGLVDREYPELSGLVLSLLDREGRPRDGFLRSFEISQLDLPVDLVVLSACQTAVGLDVRGEGMLGLARSFLNAGARRAVVSLWRINDRATSDFMGRFYRRLLKDGLGAAAALRATQIETLTRDETTAPYFWAAFVLQGDWQ